MGQVNFRKSYWKTNQLNQEVKDNGINLGEIVKVQTKKIEELTLYLIQQEERIKALEAKPEKKTNKQKLIGIR